MQQVSQYGIKVIFLGIWDPQNRDPRSNSPREIEKLVGLISLPLWMGVQISGHICFITTIYLYIGVVNSGRHDRSHIQKSFLNLTLLVFTSVTHMPQICPLASQPSLVIIVPTRSQFSDSKIRAQQLKRTDETSLACTSDLPQTMYWISKCSLEISKCSLESLPFQPGQPRSPAAAPLLFCAKAICGWTMPLAESHP